MQAIVRDWQLNGVFGAFSGNPYTMTGSGTLVNTPSNQQTADLVGTYNITDKIGSAGAWFDTTAFAQPTGVRFGNTGRNQFYGPGGWNLDLGVQRSFPVGGQKRLEARITAGNIFNKPVFANPQGNVTSGTFGQITCNRGRRCSDQLRLHRAGGRARAQVHLLALITDCGSRMRIDGNVRIRNPRPATP